MKLLKAIGMGLARAAIIFAIAAFIIWCCIWMKHMNKAESIAVFVAVFVIFAAIGAVKTYRGK